MWSEEPGTPVNVRCDLIIRIYNTFLIFILFKIYIVYVGLFLLLIWFLGIPLRIVFSMFLFIYLLDLIAFIYSF